MGRLEKQIIAGALSLVAILLSVVVFKGLRPHDEGASAERERSRWNTGGTPPLSLGGESLSLDGGTEDSAALGGSVEIGLGGPEPRSGATDAGSGPATPREAGLAGGAQAKPAEAGARPAPRVDADPGTYVVRKDDGSLSEIAQRELGDAQLWREIAALNPKIDPNRIYPGQRIRMPTPDRLRRESDAEKAVPKKDVPSGARTHTVRRGERLWDLAERYYGEGAQYVRIVEANRHLIEDDGHEITEGWVLVIPE